MKKWGAILLIVMVLPAFGQSKKAVKSFEKAKEALKAQEIDDALAHLQKALAADPNYPEAWSMQGDIYFTEKEYDEASAAYEEALNVGGRSFIHLQISDGLHGQRRLHFGPGSI